MCTSWAKYRGLSRVAVAEHSQGVSRTHSFDSLPSSSIASSSLRPRDSLNLWQLDTVSEAPYGSWEKPSQAIAFPCPGIPFAVVGGKLWPHGDASWALCSLRPWVLQRVLSGLQKSLVLICLQMSVQAHPSISRKTTAPASSGEISHGVKCSYNYQKWDLHTKPTVSPPLW